MTWELMVSIEPRLQALYEKAKAYHKAARNDKNFCANRVWYGRDGLKAELLKLVGWEAEVPTLNIGTAYDIAYKKIYEALPNCRHEGGMC